MQVKLSKVTVDVKDEMSWGDNEEIQAIILSGLKLDGKSRKALEEYARRQKAGIDAPALDVLDGAESIMQMNGTVMLEAKYRAADLLILSILENDTQKPVEYSRDWLRNLSMADGQKLTKVIDEVRAKTEVAENLEETVTGK